MSNGRSSEKSRHRDRCSHFLPASRLFPEVTFRAAKQALCLVVRLRDKQQQRARSTMCLVRNKQLLGTIQTPAGTTAGGTAAQSKEQQRRPSSADDRTSSNHSSDAGGGAGEEVAEDVDVAEDFVDEVDVLEECSEVVLQAEEVADRSAVAVAGSKMPVRYGGAGVNLREATAAVVAAATELIMSEDPAPDGGAQQRHLVPVFANRTLAAALPCGPPPWNDGGGGGETGGNGGAMRMRRDNRSRSRSMPYPCSPGPQQQQQRQQQQQKQQQHQQQRQPVHSTSPAAPPGTGRKIIQCRNRVFPPPPTRKEAERDNNHNGGKAREERRTTGTEYHFSSTDPRPPDRGGGGGGGRGDSDSGSDGGGGGVDEDRRRAGNGGQVGPMVEVFWRLKFKNRPVRAGVIRNLNNPARPLAFYFLPS